MANYWKGIHQSWMLIEKKPKFGRHIWKQRWCALGKTGVLYIFKESDSIKPYISVNTKESFLFVEKNIFKLKQNDKVLVSMKSIDDTTNDQWIDNIRSVMSEHD
jgi:hypothetical protein